jgi:hypothetical protein
VTERKDGCAWGLTELFPFDKRTAQISMDYGLLSIACALKTKGNNFLDGCRTKPFRPLRYWQHVRTRKVPPVTDDPYSARCVPPNTQSEPPFYPVRNEPRAAGRSTMEICSSSSRLEQRNLSIPSIHWPKVSASLRL